MATKKKLLQAAAGAAGGAGGLNVEQVFSTYLYEGNGDTQVIENGINLGQSNYGNSIYFPDGDGDYLATATLPQFAGVFTFEFWFYSYDSARAVYLIDKGARDTNFSIQTNYLSDDHLFVKVAGASFSYTTAGLDADGWNHIAVVRDSSNNVATFVNGTRRGSPTAASGTVTGGAYYIGSSSTGLSASGYELMYGHMSSVRISDNERYSTSSTSITVPTSEFTSDSNTVLLLGQGDTPLADASSNSYGITVNGNPRASEVGPYTAADAGEGGMVWIKRRNSVRDYFLFDTERGTTKWVESNTTDAEATASNTLTSFNSSGFSLGSYSSVNGTGSTPDYYASWTFRKAPKFFDVVTWTGTGSPRTISHNLGTTVGCMLVKRTSGTTNWRVYHRSNTSQPETEYLMLDMSTQTIDSNTVWNDTAPTDTEFTVGTSSTTNGSGETYVAYLFAHNDGDGDFGPDGDADIIKCGSYTTDGSGVATVDLGFEPQWIMYKSSAVSGSWVMLDVMRGIVTGGSDSYLLADSSNAEVSSTDFLEVNANGFEYNFSGHPSRDFIYIAIRRGPMAVPTDADDVFAIDFPDTTAPQYDAGFPVDMAIEAYRGGNNQEISSRLTNGRMYTNITNVEDKPTLSYDQMTGWKSFAISNTTQLAYMWKRAPNYFDVVTYAGAGAAQTINHNLGVAPEMIWFKSRSNADNWVVYVPSLGNKKLYLNLTNAITNASGGDFNDTAPTDTVFSVGDGNDTNRSGGTHIAYLFASVDGVSKVGSYTGNGSTQNIDCGFSSGARFVLIKISSGGGNWNLWDSERGIVAGNDPYLRLNTTDAEVTAYDLIDPYTPGFTVSANAVNSSGQTYIYYAIA